MIDFYFWTTPNGYKILMFLKETGIPYRIMPVNIVGSSILSLITERA